MPGDNCRMLAQHLECERLNTVGVRVDAIDTLKTVVASALLAIEHRKPWLMTFANPATAVVAKRSPELRTALSQFDLVAPDGIGMVIAMRLLHQRTGARISFDSTSLAPLIFSLAQSRSISIVLVGGAPGVAEAAEKNLAQAYPGIKIAGAFDGYADPRTLISAIIPLSPGIVIVGMGTIIQERFLLSLVNNGWVGLGFTCGGYLDQVCAKGMKYYPSWINTHNLRWAYRLATEPRRLWWRYVVQYPAFFVGLCLALLGPPEADTNL